MARNIIRQIWRRIRRVFLRTPSPPKRCTAFKVSEDNAVVKLEYSQDEPMVSLYACGIDLFNYGRMEELTEDVAADAVDVENEVDPEVLNEKEDEIGADDEERA